MNTIHQKSFLSVKNGGFTLIELLVFVLIIGILAAVALPQYQMAVDKAHYTQLQTLVKSAKDAAEVYYLANGSYPAKLADLDMDFPSECRPKGDGSIYSCGEFSIDLYYGGQQNIVGRYTPGHPKWEDPGADVLYYAYWLDFSGNHAGKRECRASGSHMQSVCSSLSASKTSPYWLP